MEQDTLSKGLNQDVAITTTQGGVAEAANRAIQLLGGMDTILGGRRIAVLKPNFVAGRPSRTGATTSFELIAAVAELVQSAGATAVLYESAGTEFDDTATYAILGVPEFCQKHGIGFARPGDQWIEVRPSDARRLKRFRIPSVVDSACLINLPVLKTHVVSGMSLAMKNPMGLLPREDRRTMHTLGIQQCIVDLNRGIKPDLNIIDGHIGQEGDGPLYGRSAHLGVLVSGRDSLSVDIACCQMVGVEPANVPHLRLAQEQLGRREPHLLGDQVGKVKQLELPQTHPLYRFAFWLMYPLDYPFHRLTGTHLCTALYHTGLIGTRPQIRPEACTRCGVCVQTCPLPNVIDLRTFRIDTRTCERCLLCYEACPENAIAVKGKSGTHRAPAYSRARGES